MNIYTQEEQKIEEVHRYELTRLLKRLREGHALADDVSVDELAKLSIERGMKVDDLKIWVKNTSVCAITRNLCLTEDGKGLKIKPEIDEPQCQKQDFLKALDLC